LTSGLWITPTDAGGFGYRVHVTFPRTEAAPLGLVSVVALAAAMLAGCTPAPEPDPTPTAAFASEEEAFAAAEEVYRAYIRASNAVDFQDPHTFESLEQYTSGDYLSDEREQLSEMHANGYIRGGAIEVIDFRGTRFDGSETITARTCNDVSKTTFTASDGTNLVPPDREERYALDLTFTAESGTLYLTGADAVEDSTCAS
jgi:hypothetical protein